MNIFLRTCLLLLFALLLSDNNLMGQCSSYPVPFEQRVSKAVYIVEGKVVEQHTYTDTATGNIYTLNKFHVAAWLKQHSADADVYVITLGGLYGNKAMLVDPALQLDMQHEYLLMLEADNTQIDDKEFRSQYPRALQVLTYADAQGSLTNENNLYHDLYYRTPISESTVFEDISKLTNEFATTPSGERFVPRPIIKTYKPANVAGITGFNPASVHSGTILAADQLTISGSGFGSSAGTVFFSNADDGGATFVSSGVANDNVSWSGTSIVVMPARAGGTGPINVNGSFTSASNLTIPYAHLNINSTFSGFGSTTRQRYYLVDKNGLGGYTYTYNSSFAAITAAKSAFERSLLLWRCNTFVNFRVSSTTSSVSTAVLDGINLVLFDASLPAGVLGRATTRLTGSSTVSCNLTNTVWWADELDMQFAPDPPVTGFTWQYGSALPTSSQYDFESVSSHEMGHHHGLAHVITAGDMMYYALANGSTARTLSTDDIAGGVAKMAYSTTALCFTPATVNGPMTALTAGTCTLPIAITDFRGERKNASANKLYWTTTYESDNKGFFLERSLDGIHFNELTFMAGSGNSNLPRSYEFMDTKAGMFPYYYRLRQLDMSGLERYSKTIFINGDENINVKLWASETGDKIFIYLRSLTSSSTLRILNTLGQQVFVKQVDTGAGEIPVGQLPKGIYYYQLILNGKKISGKLLLGS